MLCIFDAIYWLTKNDCLLKNRWNQCTGRIRSQTFEINIPQTIPPAQKQLTFQWATKKPSVGIFFKYSKYTKSITVQIIGSYMYSEEWHIFLSILNNYFSLPLLEKPSILRGKTKQFQDILHQYVEQELRTGSRFPKITSWWLFQVY